MNSRRQRQRAHKRPAHEREGIAIADRQAADDTARKVLGSRVGQHMVHAAGKAFAGASYIKPLSCKQLSLPCGVLLVLFRYDGQTIAVIDRTSRLRIDRRMAALLRPLGFDFVPGFGIAAVNPDISRLTTFLTAAEGNA